MKSNDNTALGRSLWRLVRFARPHSRRIVMGLAANAAARFFDLLPMIVVGRVVDTVSVALRDGTPLVPAEFAWAGLLVLGTFAGLAIFQSVSDYTLDATAQRIRHDLRVELYTHVQKLDVSYFESRQIGDIMAVLAGEMIRRDVMQNAVPVCRTTGGANPYRFSGLQAQPVLISL